MEEIKINKLERKGNMLIVKHDKGEHTMNTGWQEDLVSYIENEVGEGGSVLVEMQDKPNKLNPSKMYHNITQVDITSGVKGTVDQVKETLGKAADLTATNDKYRTPQEISAQTLTGIYCRNQVMDGPDYVWEAYEFFLGKLE